MSMLRVWAHKDNRRPMPWTLWAALTRMWRYVCSEVLFIHEAYCYFHCRALISTARITAPVWWRSTSANVAPPQQQAARPRIRQATSAISLSAMMRLNSNQSVSKAIRRVNLNLSLMSQQFWKHSKRKRPSHGLTFCVRSVFAMRSVDIFLHILNILSSSFATGAKPGRQRSVPRVW